MSPDPKRFNFMFDVFKEGAEAWLQRIKSPILGSIFFAFVAINWKVLFFTIFSDAPLLVRFDFFDQNTNRETLIFCPISIGETLAVLIPFVNLFGTFLVRWPVEQSRILQAKSANNVMIRKNEFATERAEADAAYKEAALRSARATQAIDDADLDDTTRLDLVEQLEENLSLPSSSLARTMLFNKLGVFDRLLIATIGDSLNDPGWEQPENQEGYSKEFIQSYSEIVPAVTNSRLVSDTSTSIKKLRKMGIVNCPQVGHYNLYPKGYEVYDELKS